jgi:phage anti-repressor protein
MHKSNQDHETRYQPLFRRLSEEFMLEYHDHDWGYINANAQRVSDFLELFESQIEIVLDEARDLFIYEMTDLIIESSIKWLSMHDEFPYQEIERLRGFWAQIQGHHAQDMARVLMSGDEQTGCADKGNNAGEKLERLLDRS